MGLWKISYRWRTWDPARPRRQRSGQGTEKGQGREFRPLLAEVVAHPLLSWGGSSSEFLGGSSLGSFRTSISYHSYRIYHSSYHMSYQLCIIGHDCSPVTVYILQPRCNHGPSSSSPTSFSERSWRFRAVSGLSVRVLVRHGSGLRV